jgi:hypothetical protein
MGSIKDKKTKQSSKTQDDKKGARGYMSLRNNVYDLKLELWHILKPLEYYLVDVIIDKTIKFNIKEAKITIQQFRDQTRRHHSEIYRGLKVLETKKVIIRTKCKDYSVFMLNEDYFGGLLIKRFEDALKARRNKIKIVVDNSKSKCEPHTPDVSETHTSSVNHTQGKCEIHTQERSQDGEIIEEIRPLNTLLKDISLNTSLKDSKTGVGESFTPLWKEEKEESENERNKRLAERKLELRRQSMEIENANKVGVI